MVVHPVVLMLLTTRIVDNDEDGGAAAVKSKSGFVLVGDAAVDARSREKKDVRIASNGNASNKERPR